MAKKTYTQEQVLEASIRYFEGEEAVALAWLNNYAKRNADGQLIELTPTTMDWHMAKDLATISTKPRITEVRPKVLECDVVRFQNNKEKWVAFVGLLDGYPYEIFTGLQDDEEGIILPKSVVSGRIIKNLDENGVKRYDFQFQNKRGYKTTRMPVEQVIKLVDSLQFDNENINTWKVGVERALKKYTKDDPETDEVNDDI